MTSSGTDGAARFKFTMGESVGTIWIDDVKLQSGDRNIYRRDFDHGVALVNPTDRAVYVNLQGTYRKITGSQARTVNTGGLVAAVTLQPKDGLVLLRAAPGEYVAMPSTAGRPVSVSTVRVRRKLALRGTVSPAEAPGTVTIYKYRRVGKRWRSAGIARVRVYSGVYRYTFKPSKRGLWRFAARYSGNWDGTTGWAASRSGYKNVRVK
jgi:hypothetical protein